MFNIYIYIHIHIYTVHHTSPMSKTTTCRKTEQIQEVRLARWPSKPGNGFAMIAIIQILEVKLCPGDEATVGSYLDHLI